MAKVIPFPKTERARRVDALCDALVRGPRELVQVEPHEGSICLRVADREVWGSPEDLEELVEDIQEAVDRARELARKGVR